MRKNTLTKPANLQSLPDLDACIQAPNRADLSRSARHLGIRPEAVFIESEVLDRYAELDTAIGLNAAGVVLSVLAAQLGVNPGGVASESVTVCLLRREDARPVEVDLQIHRLRRRGGECLLLRHARERTLEVQVD